jgi:hypothetical protein
MKAIASSESKASSEKVAKGRNWARSRSSSFSWLCKAEGRSSCRSLCALSLKDSILAASDSAEKMVSSSEAVFGSLSPGVKSSGVDDCELGMIYFS